MPLNHTPCADPHGIISACHFLPHNDGTPNPIGCWDAWVAACQPSDFSDPTGTIGGATMHVCRGLWAFTDQPTVPDGYFLILEGDGQEVSRLKVTAPGASGLVVSDIAAARLQGLSVLTYGAMAHGLLLACSARAMDRFHLVDIQVITQSVNGAAVTLLNSGPSSGGGDLVIDRCRFLNYSPAHPSPALRVVDFGGLHLTGHTEIHNFSPAAEVIALHNVTRLVATSGLIGSNASITSQTPPQYRLPGRAYFSISGYVRGLGIYGTKIYSDNGTPPAYGLVHEPGSSLNYVDIRTDDDLVYRSALHGGSPSLGSEVSIKTLGAP